MIIATAVTVVASSAAFVAGAVYGKGLEAKGAADYQAVKAGYAVRKAALKADLEQHIGALRLALRSLL